MEIIIDGVQIPLWPVGVVVLVVAALLVAYRVHRNRTRFQREFGKAIRGVGEVQRSIHPDQERLP